MTAAKITTPIVITGIGLRTGVGTNTAQTATSVLAGLNRFRSWPRLGVDLGSDEPGLPTASPITGFDDATWVEKAQDLATPPLQEALFSAGLFSTRDLAAAYGREKVTAFVATPYPDRCGVEPVALRVFLADAAEHCIVDLRAIRVSFEHSSHAGGVMALARAVDELGAGEADVCVVGGIDSLLETRFLEQEIAGERIKLDTTADGLIPGEGACFLVLERFAEASRRGARIRGGVAAIASALEPIAYDGGQPLRASGLSEAMLDILEDRDPHAPAIADVFVDLNGERGRFQEWALAEGRVLHRLPYGWRLHHPASSVGDIGAAAGPLLVGLAAETLDRRRARGEAALVCATSARGERACALITGPTLAVH